MVPPIKKASEATIPPGPIAAEPDQPILTLPTGELEIVEPKDTAEQRHIRPIIETDARLRNGPSPPPTPDRSLLPTVTYHPLYKGSQPARTVHEAINALSLDQRIEQMPSYPAPVPGVYCLIRPSSTEQTVAFQPSSGARIEQYGVSAFRARAYELAQQEIAELAREKQTVRKQGIRYTLMGAGIGISAVTFAIAATWGIKGEVDSGRFFEANHATATDRAQFARNTYEEVAIDLKELEQRTGGLNQTYNNIKNDAKNIDGTLITAKFNAESARAQADETTSILTDQVQLTSTFWELLDVLEPRIKEAKEDTTSNLYALQTMQRTLDAWDAIPARAQEIRATLQYRFPAYQLAASLLQKFGKSNADMHKQQVAYLKALKDETKRDLVASITTQLAGNPDPQLFHATVAAYAQFTAQNTEKPKNSKIVYDGQQIKIEADNCIDATVTLANTLNIAVPLKERFIAIEQTSCKPNGQDLNTQANFKGTYNWGI